MNGKKLDEFQYWPQLITVIIICVAFFGYRYFAYYYTRSDDAYVAADIINISPLVSGPITEIYINENQAVKKGDKLIQIDPRPYNYALQTAKAKLQLARFDNDVLAAKAAVNKAQYFFDNTLIVAPTDGYITNFNLRKGQYVKIGEGLFALVDTSQWWVLTRYKETVIRLIKAGDKAKITLDMYPGKTFHGHVKSIGWGINRVQSGNVAPSTLVYLEPTEHWIRIAQRFPVRIYFDEIDPAFPLRIGASAITTTYR